MYAAELAPERLAEGLFALAYALALLDGASAPEALAHARDCCVPAPTGGLLTIIGEQSFVLPGPSTLQ